MLTVLVVGAWLFLGYWAWAIMAAHIIETYTKFVPFSQAFGWFAVLFGPIGFFATAITILTFHGNLVKSFLHPTWSWPWWKPKEK